MVRPDGSQIGFLLFVMLLGGITYGTIVLATRYGNVAVIAPLQYSGLILEILVDVFVLGEHPDALTFIGAALVTASSLFILWREHLVRKNLAYNQIDPAVAALRWSFINEWHITPSPDPLKKQIKRKSINEHDC